MPLLDIIKKKENKDPVSRVTYNPSVAIGNPTKVTSLTDTGIKKTDGNNGGNNGGNGGGKGKNLNDVPAITPSVPSVETPTESISAVQTPSDSAVSDAVAIAMGNKPDAKTYSYADYLKEADSSAYDKAKAAVDDYYSNPIDKWSGGTYGNMVNDVMNKILNREKFSYDVNADALYQQYKNQYMQMGNQAMQDTMGQAAALTGGYGNSYANTAGNQAYQSYLQQLNDRIPELYQLALNTYNSEGDALNNQLAMLNDAYAREYGEYQNNLTDWYRKGSVLEGIADREGNDYNTANSLARTDAQNAYTIDKNSSDDAYARWRDEVGDAWNEKNWDHTLEREAKSDEITEREWQNTLDRQAREDEVVDREWNHQLSQDAINNALKRLSVSGSENSSDNSVDVEEKETPSGTEKETIVEPKKTKQTDAFFNAFGSASDFYQRGGAMIGNVRYTDYLEYITDVCERMYDSGELTAAEVAYIQSVVNRQ